MNFRNNFPIAKIFLSKFPAIFANIPVHIIMDLIRNASSQLTKLSGEQYSSCKLFLFYISQAAV